MEEFGKYQTQFLSTQFSGVIQHLVIGQVFNILTNSNKYNVLHHVLLYCILYYCSIQLLYYYIDIGCIAVTAERKSCSVLKDFPLCHIRSAEFLICDAECEHAALGSLFHLLITQISQGWAPCPRCESLVGTWLSGCHPLAGRRSWPRSSSTTRCAPPCSTYPPPRRSCHFPYPKTGKAEHYTVSRGLYFLNRNLKEQTELSEHTSWYWWTYLP